jgi:hypothetical protein
MANDSVAHEVGGDAGLGQYRADHGRAGIDLALVAQMPFTRGMHPLWMLACEGGDDGDAAWVEVKVTPAACAALAMLGVRTRESAYMGNLSARRASATSSTKLRAGCGRAWTA